MLPELRYRTGKIEDLEELKQLGLLAFGQYFSQLSPDAGEKLRSGLNDSSKVLAMFNMSHCFVCTHQEKIVGMAYLVPSGNPWDVFPADWSYIRMVSVNPAYGGQGIAKKLTAMCLDFAKQNNEKTIALHTSEMMHAARHIYESFGFKVLREIEPRFGKKYWLYKLDL